MFVRLAEESNSFRVFPRGRTEHGDSNLSQKQGNDETPVSTAE